MDLFKIAAFTTAAGGGNPAGVALCSGLPSPEAMQRTAAALGYSETVFASPIGERRWAVRYFSPENEVPFCGHATVALGAVLGEQREAGRHHLRLAGGEIAVTASNRGGTAYAELSSLPTSHDEVPDAVRRDALALFGYRPEELDPSLPFVRASAGASHLIVPLRSRSALARMTYALEAGRRFMTEQALTTVAFVWREGERVFHARNAFASGGVLEDPATGAAAAALAGLLRDRALLDAGTLTILQGEDMGRPSRIDGAFTDLIGAPVTIGGACLAIDDRPLPAREAIDRRAMAAMA